VPSGQSPGKSQQRRNSPICNQAIIVFTGGSTKILTFVAVVMLTTLRRQLLAATTGEIIRDELAGISDETSEVIGNMTVDLWQKYGSPLQAGDIRKDDTR